MLQKHCLILAAVFIMLCCSSTFAAPNSPKPQDQAAPVYVSSSWELAEISGSTIYVAASMSEDVLRLVAEVFEERTNCHVIYSVLTPAQALTYLSEPGTRCDVFLGGTTDLHETMKMEGHLLYREQTGGSDSYSWRYNDHDSFWEPVCLEMLSIGINEPLFESVFPGEQPPATLQDLADPRYKNKIIMTDPDTTYTGLTLALSVLRSHGREEGSKLLKAIGDNVGEYAVTDLTAAQKTAMGLYPITLGAFSSQHRIKSLGLPLEPTVYANAGWSIMPISILKDTKSLTAAKAFMDFVLSHDGSELICSISHALPAREDTVAPKNLSHRLRDYPVSDTFWSYREISQREYAMTLMQEIKEEYTVRHGSE